MRRRYIIRSGPRAGYLAHSTADIRQKHSTQTEMSVMGLGLRGSFSISPCAELSSGVDSVRQPCLLQELSHLNVFEAFNACDQFGWQPCSKKGRGAAWHRWLRSQHAAARGRVGHCLSTRRCTGGGTLQRAWLADGGLRATSVACDPAGDPPAGMGANGVISLLAAVGGADRMRSVAMLTGVHAGEIKNYRSQRPRWACITR